MKQDLKIGLIQMKCVEDSQENFSKAIDFIRQAAGMGAKIVCTQELFKSRYFCQVEDETLFDLAEEVHAQSETVKILSDLASELDIAIVASLFEKRAPGLYHNSTVVMDADGSYLGKYHKMHIPDDPLYYEKFYFTPGDIGYQVFKTRYANIGVLICWDQWFPEAARLTAMKGAQIIFIPTAIGNSPGETYSEAVDTASAWQIVQRGHAVANAVFIAPVNRVGFEPNPAGEGGIDFFGTSFIADPSGSVVEKASQDQEEILIGTVDLNQIDLVRRYLAHFFRDRRIDSYQGLLERYLDADD